MPPLVGSRPACSGGTLSFSNSVNDFPSHNSSATVLYQPYLHSHPDAKYSSPALHLFLSQIEAHTWCSVLGPSRPPHVQWLTRRTHKMQQRVVFTALIYYRGRTQSRISEGKRCRGRTRARLSLLPVEPCRTCSAPTMVNCGNMYEMLYLPWVHGFYQGSAT